MTAEKVLVLTSVASMIEQFNIPNIKLLIKMGYKVNVACNFEDGNTCSGEQIKNLKRKLLDLDVEYHQIDFKRNVFKIIDNIKAYKQICNIINKKQFKFIHCQSPIGGFCGRLACKNMKNIQVIYTAHGFHFFKGAPLKNWLIYYPIEKYLSKYTDKLITINKEDYNRAKNKFKAKQTFYVPGVGIDTEKFQNVKIDKVKKRKELEIPEDAFLIISVGELNKNKNHEVIIDAIAKINNPNIYYVICGQGNLKDYLNNKIKNLNLQKNIKLLGYRTDIKEINTCADLFVFPSKREGLPVSMMEAMAGGLPIICSKIRGNIDLIENKKLLVKNNDIDEYVEKITSLYESDNLKKITKNENINKIKNFNIENVNKNISEIYLK